MNVRGIGTVVESDEPYDLYECWVQGDRGSFNKYKSDDVFGVAVWLMNSLRNLPMHGHIHIVKHKSSEYSE